MDIHQKLLLKTGFKYVSTSIVGSSSRYENYIKNGIYIHISSSSFCYSTSEDTDRLLWVSNKLLNLILDDLF